MSRKTEVSYVQVFEKIQEQALQSSPHPPWRLFPRFVASLGMLPLPAVACFTQSVAGLKK